MKHKVYKGKDKNKISTGVVNMFESKNRDSLKSVVYFEEPKLQASFKKFVDSAKELHTKDKKILIKEMFED